jgi:RNA polymerase sigma factor (sigma-70 family)
VTEGTVAIENTAVEDLLRRLAPQVLGTLVRRYGQFEECEDAVQEAVLAAALSWPAEGSPASPRGWLTTVAARRLVDQMRSEHARRQREVTAAALEPRAGAGEDDGASAADDTLVLLFLCCHPALTAASQTALTLRAVGGLTTAEIARAFLVPEATMAARISRAKHTIKAAGSQFTMPAPAERHERLRVVLQVLYLIFNEGYTASSGTELHRPDLAGEAIRLARMVRRELPGDGEVIKGPQAGLDLLATLDGDDRIARHYLLPTVRAHLLERTGDHAAAREHYKRAARATASITEQRYLESRAARLKPGPA